MQCPCIKCTVFKVGHMSGNRLLLLGSSETNKRHRFDDEFLKQMLLLLPEIF